MSTPLWRKVAGTGVFIPFLATTWIVSGILTTLAQVLARIVMLPMPRDWFVTVNSMLLYQWLSQIVWLVDWWGGTHVRFFCPDGSFKPTQKKENAVVCGNHYGEVDWTMGLITADRMGELGGCKSYMKDSAKWVPIIGWCFWLSDFIFLARNWAEDKAKLGAAFRNLKSYPSNVPWFIACFCEGTRQTPSKIKASQEWCAQNGKPKLQHVLWPRTKGFTASCQELSGKLDAVYSITMAAPDKNRMPTFLNMLLAAEPVIHLIFRRRSAEDLPKDEEGLKEYCCDMHIEKDADIEHCLTKGQFPGEEFQFPPKKAPVVMFGIWFLVVQGGFAYMASTSAAWCYALGLIYGLTTLGLAAEIAFATLGKDKRKKKTA